MLAAPCLIRTHLYWLVAVLLLSLFVNQLTHLFRPAFLHYLLLTRFRMHAGGRKVRELHGSGFPLTFWRSLHHALASPCIIGTKRSSKSRGDVHTQI